jgi:hypothetical protein
MSALTENLIQRLAPDDDVFQSGRGLVRQKSFGNLGRSADGTWLLGACKGSGKQPYAVSVDLIDPEKPVARCSCPSRKFPCKHGVGLMLAFLQSPQGFGTREPAGDLLARRTKLAARKEKAPEPARESAAPRKVNTAALAKKAAAQHDGLDLLAKLLADLVTAGKWFEKARLDRLERQGRQLNDFYVPGTRVTVQRLVLLGRDQKVSEEDRAARAADLVGRLWDTVRKGREYLDAKAAGSAELDPAVEDALGKVWQSIELRDLGHVRCDLSLMELAHERSDDDAAEMRVETSHLVELGTGTLYQAIGYRPFKGMSHVPEQPSYPQPLKVAEAVVYPGFVNRRVRWDRAAEQAEEPTPAHRQAAYRAAAPAFAPVLAALREQLKHPLAPRELVALLRCERVGRVGDTVVLLDAAGERIAAADRAGAPTVANLARAAGMASVKRPAVLARLAARPPANGVAAEPLAVLTPDCHLRLGV